MTMNAKERFVSTVCPAVDGDMEGPIVSLKMAEQPLLVHFVNFREVAGDRSPGREDLFQLGIGVSKHLLKLNVQKVDV